MKSSTEQLHHTPAAFLSPDTRHWGPFNATFTRAGDGLVKTVTQGALHEATAQRQAPFTVSAWFRPARAIAGEVSLAGLGSEAGSTFMICARQDCIILRAGIQTLMCEVSLAPNRWSFVAASVDLHTARLYVNGAPMAEGSLTPHSAHDCRVYLAPRSLGAGYAGLIAGLRVHGAALELAQLQAIAGPVPRAELLAFESGSPHWPVQVKQQYGQAAPQEAWTLPRAHAPFSPAVAKPAYDGPVLSLLSTLRYAIKGWQLQAAPEVALTDIEVALAGVDTTGWHQATVPGTVLTTLVDCGVYPDPAIGLNNFAIPEKLCRQDYWYRSQFEAPPGMPVGRHVFLIFKGINYAAQVYLNGHAVGTITGAFMRGQFDISAFLNRGATNALAVRISPPPHPGIPHEESLAAGPGQNGGYMALDGPTFMASEGWDWMPAVRDRNTGIWQEVELSHSGAVRLGDVRIVTTVTTLPQGSEQRADISFSVPLRNLGDLPIKVRLAALVAGCSGDMTPIALSRQLWLKPGENTVAFSPKEEAALSIADPRLWWPNGYGKPDLHLLTLQVFVDNTLSDESETRFGIRQVTYELSLVDQHGELQRVEADFSRACALGVRITDGSHEGVRKVAGGLWASSLRPEAEGCAAVTPLADARLAPFVVIKVNGVRMAARGGNWGMDDWMKRVSRERLEPYFKLHQQANINIIRNWVGQNTEEVFYALADEYGLMVLNDFWCSTQDHQLEPQDVGLFLENAQDCVLRFRNHPSIVMWLGRNEGMPQPILNDALQALIEALDGTRWYSGNSRLVNMQESGPWNYRPPEAYFGDVASGFSTEVGTQSFPTLESFMACVPEQDRWPISDSWAYHDWHSADNGDTAPFEAAMHALHGAPLSLRDFERKAQLMNYENHRAIFEGMNAGLWSKNSGRLLWMTQPAWPSTQWQILSHDYDTHGAFYGVQKALEPVHIQMNLPGYEVLVVNTVPRPLEAARIGWTVHGIDGAVLTAGSRTLSLDGVALSAPLEIGIAALLARQPLLFVRLTLHHASGELLSQNTYWPGAQPLLATLAPQHLALHAIRTPLGVEVTLHNGSPLPVLSNKLTLNDLRGERILPAYYSDNYLALMPDERRTVSITFSGDMNVCVALRGWNTHEQSITL